LVNVAAPAVSVGLSKVSRREPDAGDCGDGAEAFNVAPSAGVTVGAVGGVGLSGALFWQAMDAVMSKVAPSTDKILCGIRNSILAEQVPRREVSFLMIVQSETAVNAESRISIENLRRGNHVTMSLATRSVDSSLQAATVHFNLTRGHR
jgi:hypothetical protein